jgi:hypothetical protein
MKKPTLTSSHYIHPSLRFGSAGLCLAAALLANNAKAQSQYFETVANGGTYSWDASVWTTNNAVANTPPYASPWGAGSFARFYNGAGDTYTVTVNAAESMAGMFLNAGSAATLNINDAGSGTGSLSIVPGATLQDGFSFAQGFLTGGGTLTINAPIIGTGGLEEESGGGHLQLYGNNSYSGGTLFSSSSTFVDYNNNNSFGTGDIGYGNTTFSIMENTGPSTVTINNHVQILVGTTGVNFIGNGSTMAGGWNLGNFNVNLRNNGAGTTVNLSGILSNTTQAVTFSGANNGKIALSGANTYTGKTVVGVTGDTAFTLQLATANTIASSTNVTLAGGTLDGTGLHHSMTGTTLGLTTSSSMLIGAGEMDFADSSTVAWSGHLNLADWTGIGGSFGGTQLDFGGYSGGLTSAQLANIEFDGNAGTLGDAAIDSNGFVYMVPEPSTTALSLLGGLAVLWNIRRRKV